MDNESLSQALADFNDALEALKPAIMTEVPPVFSEIIEKHQSEGLYRLALYHCGEYTRYLIVSFSTENGLDQATEHYMRHSTLSRDEERLSLKWSPCDSPHHDHGYHLDDVELKLDKVRAQSELIFDEMEALYGYSDELYDILRSAHQEVHEVIVACLEEIARLPSISAWISKANGTLMLDAGDIDTETILIDIERIHDKTRRAAIEAEMKQADEYFRLKLERDQKNREQALANPPQPSFGLEDLKPAVDAFSPDVIFEKGIFSLSGQAAGEIPQHENTMNRIELFPLLAQSTHWDEIDKLYGDYIGVQFKPGDLIPCFAEQIADKLCRHLQQKFPETCFVIEISVDRHSLSYITFHQGDETSLSDGYQSKQALYQDAPEQLIGFQAFLLTRPSFMSG